MGTGAGGFTTSAERGSGVVLSGVELPLFAAHQLPVLLREERKFACGVMVCACSPDETDGAGLYGGTKGSVHTCPLLADLITSSLPSAAAAWRWPHAGRPPAPVLQRGRHRGCNRARPVRRRWTAYGPPQVHGVVARLASNIGKN